MIRLRQRGARRRWSQAATRHSRFSTGHGLSCHTRRAARLVGCLLVAGGMALLSWQAHVRSCYGQLAQEVSLSHVATSTDAATVAPGDERTLLDVQESIDWASLRMQNADIAAWVRVEGSGIDLPVVSTQARGSEYYLTHDFWQHWAFEGTPFLDHRCGPDDAHRLVFGHHLATQGQFSALQKAYQPEVFSRLGACTWSTPASGQTRLVPLMAQRVESSFAPIQAFGLAGTDSLRAWLSDLVHEAGTGARAPDWECLVNTAQTAVTLVTCSSEMPNQPWRTIVVFVEV